MLYAGGLTMVVAGSAAGLAQYVSYTANNSIENEHIIDEAFQADIEDVNELSGPLNILVLGVDEQGGSKRSDTMIVLHINEDLTEASMVSLPRDLYVDIPDCGPGWGNGPCTNKLNHAASISDDWDVTRANVVETIHDLTGVKFHLGATANFEGFIEMVEVVGEVEICSWKTFESHHTDRVFEEGCHFYDEDAALDMVRQRYQFYDDIDYEKGLYGDYARQNFQQQAIRSLLVQAKEQGFLSDPSKISELLSSFGDKVTLDKPDDLSLTDLVVNLRDIDPDAITSIRVPAESATVGGQDVEMIRPGTEEEADAADLWRALDEDTVDQWIAQNPEWVTSGV